MSCTCAAVVEGYAHRPFVSANVETAIDINGMAVRTVAMNSSDVHHHGLHQISIPNSLGRVSLLTHARTLVLAAAPRTPDP